MQTKSKRSPLFNVGYLYLKAIYDELGITQFQINHNDLMVLVFNHILKDSLQYLGLKPIKSSIDLNQFNEIINSISSQDDIFDYSSYGIPFENPKKVVLYKDLRDFDPSKPYLIHLPLKKIRFYLKDWAFKVDNWKTSGHPIYNISLLPCDSKLLLYKHRKVREKHPLHGMLEHNYLVTFSNSKKELDYQKNAKEIEHAKRSLLAGNQCLDCRYVTSNSLNSTLISEDEKYLGYDCYISNIKNTQAVLKLCKTKFTADLFLGNASSKSELLVAFIALTIYKNLESRLKDVDMEEVIATLRESNVCKVRCGEQIPVYHKNRIHHKLSDVFGFELE